MKLIREGRFGPPKTFKTGAVCGTYPKPMLVFEYEPGGLEILDTVRPQAKYLPVNLEGLMHILGGTTKVEDCVYYLDFAFKGTLMEDSYSPAKDRETFDNTIKAINALVMAKTNPFKTIVVDTVTGLSGSIWSHQAVTNQTALADARKWAGNIGMKVVQVIDFLTSPRINSNVVFIFHTDINKDEDTKKLSEQPMMYSKERDSIGRKFSQFFYQDIMAGKPMLRVKSFDLVRGIGCRWPSFATETIGPTFQEIYGKEKDILQ